MRTGSIRSAHGDPGAERLSHRTSRQRDGPPIGRRAGDSGRDERAAETESSIIGNDVDVVEGGSPAEDADAERRGGDLGAVQVKVDSAGQRSGCRRTNEEGEAFADRRIGSLLACDVEVRPFGEATLGWVAALQRTAYLAERGMQAVTVAVRRELLVKIEVEPVSAQTGGGSARRRPDREQLAELVSRA